MRRVYKQPRLKKDKCEICSFQGSLEIHHIIPQCDSRSHNNNSNLAIVCANCHTKVHTGEITIIGVYSTTTNDRKLMWFKTGEKPPLPHDYWLIKENPFVVTMKKQ